jgi:hypothetical protein
MIKVNFKVGLLVSLMLLALLMSVPTQAYAQWPPFSFDLNSSYADGRITYDIEFSKQVDWPMADVVFKIPLPEGTRFIEASAPPTTGVDFDGVEVTFFTPVVQWKLKDLSFVVEVMDPSKTEFTTHSWIAWKGEQAGDYLTSDFAIDTARTPLICEKPSSRLRLEAGATAADDVITYLIYPKNIGGRRMWDLSISLPLPAGTTFLSAEAPPPFETGFDGQQVVFSILEMPKRTNIEPLRVQVSTAGVTEPFVVTHASAGWTNVGRNVEEQEYTRTGDIFVQPHALELVVADAVGDTPFAGYDITSIAFQNEGDLLRTNFYSSGEFEPVGQPVEIFLYIDSDCNADTGKSRGNRGAEYWLRYRHQSGRGYIYSWDEINNTWTNRRTIGEFPSIGNMIYGWIPSNYLDHTTEFCWVTAVWNRLKLRLIVWLLSKFPFKIYLNACPQDPVCRLGLVVLGG